MDFDGQGQIAFRALGAGDVVLGAWDAVSKHLNVGCRLYIQESFHILKLHTHQSVEHPKGKIRGSFLYTFVSGLSVCGLGMQNRSWNIDRKIQELKTDLSLPNRSSLR